MRCALVTTPEWLVCRKNFGQSHVRDRSARSEQITQDVPGTDRGQLVDISD
jgi:hypothetical protein